MLAFGNSLIYKGPCNQTLEFIKGIDSPEVGEVCSTVARRGSSATSDLPSSAPIPRYSLRSLPSDQQALVSPLRTPHRPRRGRIRWSEWPRMQLGEGEYIAQFNPREKTRTELRNRFSLITVTWG